MKNIKHILSILLCFSSYIVIGSVPSNALVLRGASSVVPATVTSQFATCSANIALCAVAKSYCSSSAVRTYMSNQKTPLVSVIQKEIAKSQHSICVATYVFTHPAIADDLIQAQKRGVKVNVLIDPLSAGWEYGQASKLVKAKVPVSIHTSKFGKNVQHSKFFIFDDHTVITGSANATRAALDGEVSHPRNCESMVAIRSKKEAAKFKEFFDQMLTFTLREPEAKSLIKKSIVH